VVVCVVVWVWVLCNYCGGGLSLFGLSSSILGGYLLMLVSGVWILFEFGM